MFLSCFVSYMLWLAEDGKVLTWGHGGHGQLGHGDLANVKTPKVVEALEGQRAVSVACGGAWTTAVTGTAVWTSLSNYFCRP